MWKAFEEMEALGWLKRGQKRPKMICVQSAGCAPIPKAWDEHKQVSEAWANASTLAAGLRVPKAYGDYIILDILKQSRGAAVAVSDQEILECVREWAAEEGVFAAPEGAASLAAYKKLLAQKFLKPSDTVVLFNTGSGLKYIEVIAAALKAEGQGSAEDKSARHIGGIIGPY
jgi:threonine synthase